MKFQAGANVTLQDVANAAEVSVSTASRALNGRAKEFRIAQSTVDRIQATAKRLEFQPSRVARSLRSQRSGLIGVVVPDVSNPFFSAIAREVTLAAEEQGYSVLLADSQESTAREVKLLTGLRQQQVEALVVCPVGVKSDHLQALHESALPIVLVDRIFPELELHQVSSNQLEGAKQIARLLSENGHRSIGILQGLPDTYPNCTRIKGLQAALKEHDIELQERWIAGDNFTESSGYAAAKKLLAEYPEITALVALSIPNAYGGLRAAQQLGRDVPKDLSIVGFDDSPFAEFMQVPFSTIRQDEHQLGRVAASILLEQLQDSSNSKFHPKLLELPCELVERSSVAKVNL